MAEAQDPIIAAIVLAGSRGASDPVAAFGGKDHKCLVPVAGKPMLLWVIAALRSHAPIGRIIVVVNEPEVFRLPLQAMTGIELIHAERSPSLSVMKAIDALASDFPILLTTGDHPLLTPAMLESFIAASLNMDVDVTFGLAPREAIEKTAPGVVRTYLKFSDGWYSGTNMFFLKTGDAAKALVFWRRVEQERKKPWRIARAFGFGLLLGYLLRSRTLGQTVHSAARKIGIRAKPVVLESGEAAIDVDKVDDLVLAELLLTARHPAPEATNG